MISRLAHFSLATLVSIAIGISPISVMAADPTPAPAAPTAPATAPAPTDKTADSKAKKPAKKEKKSKKKSKKKAKAAAPATTCDVCIPLIIPLFTDEAEPSNITLPLIQNAASVPAFAITVSVVAIAN